MNNGSLRDFFTEKWKCGFSQIDKNRRKDTSNYLSKYISKAEDKDIRELLGKSRLSESDKKEVLTMILPMIAEVRAFRVSKLEFPTVQTAQAENVTEFSLSEKAKRDDPPAPLAPLTEKERDFAIAYLKTLCTKSPLNCANPVFSHQRGELLKLYKVEPSRLADLPLARNKKIAESGCRLSCKGCILSKLADLFVNGDISFMQKRNNWFYFIELWRERELITPQLEKWYLTTHISEDMINDFKRRLVKKYSKVLPEDEILPCLSAIYSTNPILYPFILPKKWQKFAQSFSMWFEGVPDKFSQAEQIFFKAMCNATFFV
jgi:hypothetical protein